MSYTTPVSPSAAARAARKISRLGRKLPSVGELAAADLICLSHLRWDFVYQRPQHLLSRCARGRRVFFFEEPIWSDGAPRLDIQSRGENLWIAVPHLPRGTAPGEAERLQRKLLDGLIADQGIGNFILWYYTPMALAFSEHLQPMKIIYDCMDELSHFKGAPPELRQREARLFDRADLVFTGGQSLYEAKRDKHPSVHAFPSSVDVPHFKMARERVTDPADQAGIGGPRLGFFGVIDERFDIELVRGVAELRPDWQLVFLGPVVKIDPATLPRHANIHYLGGKSYQELPSYLAGWDIAMLPFARNEATRFISPTKTPEYLAAAKPVISTSIRDVVRPYQELGLVSIADDAESFVRAAEAILARDDRAAWLEKVDAYLARLSWDQTWTRMNFLITAPAASRLSQLPLGVA